MRKIQQAEAESWTALARQHGFTDAEGNIEIGCCVIEPDGRGTSCMRFITPVPAGLYDSMTLAKKTPPILFDRDDAGRIIVPGRWLQYMCEELAEDDRAEDDRVPPSVREIASIAARSGIFEDYHLPPDFETIEFMASDDEGNLVLHEALPPETRIPMAIRLTPMTELEAILDEEVAWGFLETDPGPPRTWRATALGLQQQGFKEAPQEEPGFLAAWLAAYDRRYHEELKTLEGQAPRKIVDQATARVRAWMEANARELYPLAKAGDVGAFHRAFVETTRPEEEAP